MKRLLITALALILLSVSTRADEGNTNTSTSSIESISDYALKQFGYTFFRAQNVQWSNNQNLQKATFLLDNKKTYALYNMDSQFLVATQKVNFNDLPEKATKEINTKFNEFEVANTLKVLARPTDYKYNDDTNSFWVSLVKEDKQVFLIVSPHGEVNVVNSIKN